MAWHTFRWLQDDRPGMDAEHLMRRYGIPVASRHVSSRGGSGVEAGFDVPRQQAAWAEYLLCRAGWSLITPLLDQRHQAVLDHARAAGASRPVGGGRIRRQGIVAKFYGFADELVGQGAAHRERMQPPQTQWRRQLPAAPAVASRPTLWRRLQQIFSGK